MTTHTPIADSGDDLAWGSHPDDLVWGCPWCGLPLPLCLDLDGHERLHRESEAALLRPLGFYDRPDFTARAAA